MKVWTFRDAAREFGTSVVTIRDLVRAHGFETLPVPRNGNAKGLSPRHMAVLRKALNKTAGGAACRAATA